jgi:hypothetical protein
VEFDKDSKKIVLSAMEYLKGKEARIVEEYAEAHKMPPNTLDESATISGQTPAGDTSIPQEN